MSNEGMPIVVSGLFLCTARPHEEQPIPPGLGRSVFPTRKRGCLVVFFWLGTAGNHLLRGHFFVARGILEFIRT